MFVVFRSAKGNFVFPRILNLPLARLLKWSGSEVRQREIGHASGQGRSPHGLFWRLSGVGQLPANRRMASRLYALKSIRRTGFTRWRLDAPNATCYIL